MGENGKVTVKIYGQEYTIAGGDSGDRVVTVARHVDKVMTELAKVLPSMSVSSLAVLAAVNVTDDLYESRTHAAELEDVIADLRKDADHYIQLWEDAKSSFKQYKEDAQNSVEQLRELQRIFNLKNVELNKAADEIDDLKKQIDKLKEELDFEKELNSETEKDSDELKELRVKYDEAQKEYNSNLFSDCLSFCIPNTNKNLSRTGIIVDYLTYKSYTSLLPRYYDIHVSLKALGRQESIDVLALIRGTRGIEVSVPFGWTTTLNSAMIKLAQNNEHSIASAVESARDAIIAAIDKTYAEYPALNKVNG